MKKNIMIEIKVDDNGGNLCSEKCGLKASDGECAISLNLDHNEWYLCKRKNVRHQLCKDLEGKYNKKISQTCHDMIDLC